MTGRRKNLVIVRAGDGSLHRGWIAEPNRDFDLFISYYGKVPDHFRGDGDHYEHRPGPKWSCLAELLAENPGLVDQYEAFWFPDDDLSVTTETLNRMFALFHGFSLALAQPALTRDSYFSWNTLLQQPSWTLRFVGFVEVMAPLFERQALKACLDTFSQSRSGWGLDLVWPTKVGKGRHDAIAILDATPVKHTRQLGGDLYRNNPDLSPQRDVERLLALHGLQAQRAEAKYVMHGGVRTCPTPWWQRLALALGQANAWRRRRRQERRGA